jgi:WD40 repeat protein
MPGMSREVLSLKGHTGTICCVAVSPDGKRIVSGSFDRMVKIWLHADAKDGIGPQP